MSNKQEFTVCFPWMGIDMDTVILSLELFQEMRISLQYLVSENNP